MTYPHNGNDRNRNDQRDQRDNRDQRDPRNEEREEELIPEADYPVVATAWKWGYSGQQKHEQIGLRLRVTDGPLKGKSLLYYGSYHPNSEEYTMKALGALGVMDHVWSAKSGQFDSATLPSAIAVVKHETYQGKVRARVQWINGADVIMKDEMNDNDLRAFAQRMRGSIARFGGKTTNAQPQQGGYQGQRQQQPAQEQRSFGDQRGGNNQRGQYGGQNNQQDDEPPPFDDNDAPQNGRYNNRR